MNRDQATPAPPSPADPQRVHWLYRPGSARVLWIVAAVVLAISLVVQVFVHVHEYFGADGWFGFHAGYGFLTCVAMVVFAKGLGMLLKRPDDYYESRRPRPDGDADGQG